MESTTYLLLDEQGKEHSFLAVIHYLSVMSAGRISHRKRLT